jgi:Mg-chelatase subunit ChlD
LTQRQPGDIAGLILFGAEAKIAVDPKVFDQAEFMRQLKKLSSSLQSRPREWTTDIGSGLGLASLLFPRGYQPKVVLLSDGNQHAADILPQLVHSRFSNIRVDVLPLGGGRHMRDVRVEGVYVRPQAEVGQGFDLGISLAGNLVGEARLRVSVDKKPVRRMTLHLSGKGRQLIRSSLTIEEPGDYLVSVELSASNDAQPENNYGACWVSVHRQPRLLYITNSPASPSPLLEGLRKRLPLDVISPSALEAIPLRYQQYAAIVLENISAFALTGAQMRMLKEWVRQLGKGLVVIGGDRGFGAGGYLDTPLEEVLPLEMQVDDRDRRKSLGVVLVLDKSESMGGVVGTRTKLEIAMDAAVASLDWLGRRDLIGVVAFDTRAEGIVRPTSGSQKAQIAERIRTLQPGGKTNIYPGLELAHKWLQPAAVDIKHILLLSDGKSVRGNFGLLADKIAAQGITISTVGIGPDCDRQLLALISQRGGGRLFLTDDYHKLQRIFFKDLQIASQSLLRRGDFQLRLRGDHEILAGIGKPLPVVHGYVATKAKPDSQQLIVSAAGEPILSIWNYGLGRAAAFTSDAGDWIRDWLAWPYFASLWRQMLSWVGRGMPPADGLTPHFELLDDRARLWVDAVDERGLFRNGLELQARVIPPDLNARQFKLTQVEPGLYQAYMPVSDKGSYMVEVLQMEDGRVVGTAAAGFVVPYLPEAKDIYINQPLLDRIASITRGRLLKWDDNPFARSDDYGYEYTKLDTVCLLIALGLFVLELLGRKFWRFRRKKRMAPQG